MPPKHLDLQTIPPPPLPVPTLWRRPGQDLALPHGPLAVRAPPRLLRNQPVHRLPHLLVLEVPARGTASGTLQSRNSHPIKKI